MYKLFYKFYGSTIPTVFQPQNVIDKFFVLSESALNGFIFTVIILFTNYTIIVVYIIIRADIEQDIRGKVQSITACRVGKITIPMLTILENIYNNIIFIGR